MRRPVESRSIDVLMARSLRTRAFDASTDAVLVLIEVIFDFPV
jgi:hypothetical protein